MAVVHEDTCIGLCISGKFDLLKKAQPNKHNFEISHLTQCRTQRLFQDNRTCTRILTKVLESTPSNRQKLWLCFATFLCQTTKQSYKIIT